MALDVYLQSDDQYPSDQTAICQRIFSFSDDEGDYWFLYPLFKELKEETSQDIDLYGWAVFSGAKLEALERSIALAQELVSVQPDIWQIKTYIQLRPERKDIMAEVNKARLESNLSRLMEAINTARLQGAFITFFGD